MTKKRDKTGVREQEQECNNEVSIKEGQVLPCTSSVHHFDRVIHDIVKALIKNVLITMQYYLLQTP